MRRVAGLALVLFGCTGEVDTSVGVLEPVRVIDGGFHPGALPEASTGTPTITSIETGSGLFLVAERDRMLSGRTSEDAYAIGLRFTELGTGWWTVPVQDLDPAFPGERDFQLHFDVGGGVPPGIHALALAAIDERGRSGELFELDVCVRDPLLPDNLNPCDPELLPPALVIALVWNLDVDLDLVVDTPSGERISAEAPSSDKGEAMLLHDSNAACAIDGRNAEAVVWAEPPSETGNYLVRADLFDTCGASGTSLRAVVYRRVQRTDGTWTLRETARVDGAMFDIQVSGGAGTPLYLMAVEVPGVIRLALALLGPPEPAGDSEDIEIVVDASPPRDEVTTTKIDADEAARVPGSSGDAVRVVESLPGVARSTAGSGQLVVWGAAPRDTRIYVDGVPLPRLYHEGGLRSVVHPILVSSLELTPGGQGAAWGRGLGGVIRIETRTPRGEITKARIAGDLLDASAAVAVPIGERVHLAAVARFGYVKYWTDALLPDLGALVPLPVYGDGQLRLAWRASPRDQVEFVGLTSHDRFVRRVASPDPATSIADTRSLDFQRVYAKWTRDFGEGHRLIVTPFFGFGRERGQASFGELATSLNTDTWMGGVRVASSHLVRSWLRIEVGLDAEIERAAIVRRGALALPAREGDIRVFGQPPPESIATDEWTATRIGLAPYIEAEFWLAEGAVRIVPGMRIDPYVRSVSRRNPPAAATPAVGLFTQDLAVEPRLAVFVQAIERLSLRAAFGVHRQNPAPEDLSAAFGNPRLPNARALHVVSGAALDLTKTLSFELTGFLTRSRDLAMRSADAAPLPAELLLPSGRGRSYGLQVLLRQAAWKGLFGWLAYTLMRSERRDHEGAPWRLSDYDQTHVLTLVGGFELPRGFQLGARFRLASGFPRTPVVDAWFDATRNLFQPTFGVHNGDRLPLFVQLDLRLGKRFEFELSTLELYLDVLNVWNRRNTEEFVYAPDYRQRGQIYGFPILPSLGIQWDF